MKRKFTIAGLFIAAMIVLACSSKSAPVEKPGASAPAAQEIKDNIKLAASGWEREWEILMRAAKKEGKVVIYTSSPVQDALRAAFTKRYDIAYESVLISPAQALQRLNMERKAGLYMPDVYIAGASSSISIKPIGALDSLESSLMLPEVLDSAAWYQGKLPWSDQEKMIFAFTVAPTANIIVNNKLVSSGEIQSYRDLLNPKWKGKIIMDDPTTVGPGNTTFRPVGFLIINLDYWRDFVKQEPLITRDRRLEVEWVAQGKYAIALAPTGAIVEDFRAAGAPLEYIQWKEGVFLTSSTGTVSLFNRSPHPNAAKVFINWLLGKEGQRVYSRAFGAQSAREDISIEGIPIERIRRPGVKYITETLTEEWELKGPEQTKYAIEIFAPLLK